MEVDVRSLVRMGKILACPVVLAVVLSWAGDAGWETGAALAADSTAKPPTQQAPPRAPHGAGGAVAGKKVVEVGEFTATIPELTAEFAYLPPEQLRRLHDDDSAARIFALDYYGSLLFGHDAEARGLYERNPGFRSAVAAEGRRMVALVYLRDMGREEYKPTDVEIEQFYALHKERLCQKPARYRLARLGVVSGKKAGEAERKAAQERLAAMQKRLEAGDAFADVATSDSDLEGRMPGGEVGWLTDRELQGAAGLERITGLAAGERTEPIVTARGQEIYAMLERDEARLLTFDECKAPVERSLVRQFNREIRLRRMDEIAIAAGASMNIDAVIEAGRAVPRPKDP